MRAPMSPKATTMLKVATIGLTFKGLRLGISKAAAGSNEGISVAAEDRLEESSKEPPKVDGGSWHTFSRSPALREVSLAPAVITYRTATTNSCLLGST